ncbi:MAG TPA: pitrilysin family protein, partial [Acidimicrobiia bacterium]|nr:pitrilysin family protein [Acidimicrobiia bacterium]
PVDDPPAPEVADNGAGDNGNGAGAGGDQARPPSAEPWRATVPTPGPAPTMPLPSVQRFTLGNGLAVWLVESHRLPLVSASLVSRLGSAGDPPDRPGLTDLATGTLDGGTTHRDALGLSRELEAAGATLSNDTGKDGTWLSASALTAHAPAALDILADAVLHPTFPDDEVARVRDADIVALRQSADNAGTVASAVAAREVFGAGHPYGHRVTGTEDGLRAATIDDLRLAHDRAFTPTNTALVLAGDLTAAQARTLAEGAFGSWTGGSPAGGPPAAGVSAAGPSAAGASPPPQPGTPERVLIVDKPGSSQTALVLAAPGVARADPDYEPLLVTNQVFGGAFSSRLNQDLRERRGYTYGAYSSVDALRSAGLVTLAMDVETPSTADAVQAALHDADTLAASGVTADELGRARQGLVGSMPSLFATGSETLSTLRSLYLYDRPPDDYRTRPARLAGITAADVAAVARRRFGPGAFTIVAVGDRSAIEEPLRALNLGPVGPRSP